MHHRKWAVNTALAALQLFIQKLQDLSGQAFMKLLAIKSFRIGGWFEMGTLHVGREGGQKGKMAGRGRPLPAA